MKKRFNYSNGGLRGLAFSILSLASGSLLAIEPSPYFVVADDYIAPDQVEEHEAALKAFKRKADESGYQQSWRFYQFDNGRHIAFNAQSSHDYEARSDKHWQEVAEHFDTEFLQKNSEVYRKTISHQDFYLMRYQPELSLEPAEKQEQPLSHMVFVEVQLHRDKSLRASLTSWIDGQKQAKPAFYFSTYYKHYGANMPTLYLAFHTSSFVDFYQKLEKQGLLDPLQILPEEVLSAVKKYDISLGKYIPSISY